MQKRTSLLIATVAAFLAGRGVHASGYLDTITQQQPAAATPSSGAYTAQPDNTPLTPQQAQFQRAFAERDAKKAAAKQAALDGYAQEAAAHDEMVNQHAQEAEAARQAAAPPLAQGPEESAPAATPVPAIVNAAPPAESRNEEPAPAAPARHVGYPYTDD